MASLMKRKIDGRWHFMPDGEYSLCGLAYDGADADHLEVGDVPVRSAREITCESCKHRINAVRLLINPTTNTGGK